MASPLKMLFNGKILSGLEHLGKAFDFKAKDNPLVSILKGVGNGIISPILDPIRMLGKQARLFRVRWKGKGKWYKVVKQRVKAEKAIKEPNLKWYQKLGKNALYLGAAIAGPVLLKKIFGGKGKANGDNPGQQFATESNFTPIQPINEVQAQAPDIQNKATAAQVKATRDQAQSELDQKIAEAKAGQIAATKILSQLDPIHNSQPDKLREIYARSNNQSDQLDAIIQLLNQQNQTLAETRKNTLASAKNSEAQIRGQATRERELYSSLMKLQAKNSSANAEAAQVFEKSSAQIAKAVSSNTDNFKKYTAESKKGSLGKWLLLGGIAAGIYQLSKIFGSIGNIIEAGFGFVKDGFKWIGEKLGFVNENVASILGSDVVEDANDSEKESTGTQDLKDQGRAGTDGVITQDDYKNPETGNIDTAKATEEGVNTTYSVNKENIAAGGAIAGARTATTASKVLDTTLDVAETGTAATVALQTTKKGRSWLSKAGNWLKDKASKAVDVVKNSKLGQFVSKGFDVLKRVGWKALGKIIGDKGVKVLQTFASKVAQHAGKLAKMGAKKLPGPGLILGIIGAIRRAKNGDWTGAVIEALSGIASSFPGLGSAASIALDGLLIGRDIVGEKNTAKESEEVNELLKQEQEANRYKPGEKGNLYTEIIRKFGGTDNRFKENIKNEAIRKLQAVLSSKDYKDWDKARQYAEINRAIEGTGLRFNYITGQLEGIKPYEQESIPSNEVEKAPDQTVTAKIPHHALGTKSHPGGKAVVGDGGKSEVIVTPDNKAYVTPDKPTVVDIPKGSKVIPEVTDLKTGEKVPAYAEGTEFPSFVTNLEDNSNKSKIKVPIQTGGEVEIDTLTAANSHGWNLQGSIRRLKDSANSRSTGYCARYVRTALEAGGIDTSGRPSYAAAYKSYLPTIGFSEIPSSYPPQPGDIYVTSAIKGHKYGHIAMFDGKNWISDFRQRNMNIYRDVDSDTFGAATTKYRFTGTGKPIVNPFQQLTGSRIDSYQYTPWNTSNSQSELASNNDSYVTSTENGRDEDTNDKESKFDFNNDPGLMEFAKALFGKDGVTSSPTASFTPEDKPKAPRVTETESSESKQLKDATMKASQNLAQNQSNGVTMPIINNNGGNSNTTHITNINISSDSSYRDEFS